MAIFRKGQRVRLVRNQPGWDNLPKERQCIASKGCELTIIGPARIFERGDYAASTEDGRIGVVYAYQIEPIQPEGNRIISWAECKEWQPPHVRELA